MISRSLSSSLDVLSAWRRLLDNQVAAYGQLAADNDLLSDSDQALLHTLRARLASEKLVLAFVAEYSRGKSELINAIFFADVGRRVLPATPGRTTMCPVELRCDAGQAPRLSLLPAETRQQGLSLAELRGHEQMWQHRALQPEDPEALAQALMAVTQTMSVSVDQATALGFWNPTQPQDNPLQNPNGTVDVPAWRHAIINYPHPLLQRGLVVIDTPGLNAIGAEPELTLGLLPLAQAVVFVLAADTGVTRSDWAMWQDHLAQEGIERFVVLNKIDMLADPLLTPQGVELQINQQQRKVARTLGVPMERVFPVSARLALSARVEGRPELLSASGLEALENALGQRLMPRRQALLLHSTENAFSQLRKAIECQVIDRRRQLAEQRMELQGLRGKSGPKLRLLMSRVQAEAQDFDASATRLAALRAVHQRLHDSMLSNLDGKTLGKELQKMQAAMRARLFNLGAPSAFNALMQHLRQALGRAESDAVELQRMLDAAFAQLNADFGFALVSVPRPSLAPMQADLQQIEANYGKFLGFSQAWRKAAPGFSEQFRRMLQSKLQVVIENAAAELDWWSFSALAQTQAQVRDRQKNFAQRREALQRVESAADQLELRIAEVLRQEISLGALQQRLQELSQAAMETARCGPLGQADPPSAAAPETGAGLNAASAALIGPTQQPRAA